MIITVLINNEVYEKHKINDNIKIHLALSKVRNKIKNNYKQLNKKCKIWFIEIKK